MIAILIKLKNTYSLNVMSQGFASKKIKRERETSCKKGEGEHSGLSLKILSWTRPGQKFLFIKPLAKS